MAEEPKRKRRSNRTNERETPNSSSAVVEVKTEPTEANNGVERAKNGARNGTKIKVKQQIDWFGVFNKIYIVE